ncbi:MAG: stage II sporulation protein M, partial [Acidobacteriota bacterium]
MNRDEFEARHEETWEHTESLLDRLEARRRFEHELADLPHLYRQCCHHLALARQRHYGAALEARLNRIAIRGYHQLYRRRGFSVDRILRFLARGFPRLVRAHAGTFWLATALFYGPGIVMGLYVLDDPDAVFTLLGSQQLAEMEEMYRTAPSEERAASDDFTMFGFYIYNNIS